MRRQSRSGSSSWSEVEAALTLLSGVRERRRRLPAVLYAHRTGRHQSHTVALGFLAGTPGTSCTRARTYTWPQTMAATPNMA